MRDPMKQARFKRYEKRVRGLLTEGKRYKALVLTRFLTGLGLAECNKMLDEMQPPEEPPEETPIGAKLL